MEPWHSLSPETVRERLGTDLERGLSDDDAGRRLAEHGPNELAARKRITLFRMILDQFKDFLILILIAAGAVSLAVGETADAVVIYLIVVLNAALGASQERQANKALEALRRMASPKAEVIRGGRTREIPSRGLVPGDLVLIETGDFIPADLRLTGSVNLKIDESSLTGESVPVEKSAGEVLPGEAGVGDRVNSAFMGTVVTYGRGRGVVTGTGMKTQMGQIAEMLETYEEESTPLQKKLTRFGKLLGMAVLGVIGIVFILGLIRGEPLFELFMTSISLAVAAIPEGLAAIVTIVLALGMKRMVKRHALVKRLHAVEALGSVTTICSDKTGTLTKNEMTVVTIWAGGKRYELTGSGYAPDGEFREEGRTVDPAERPALLKTITCGALANDAKLERDDGGAWIVIGDPTEGALVTAARKAGMTERELQALGRRLAEIPFDSERKMMTVFHPDPDKPGSVIGWTKGAPDVVLARCTRIIAEGGVRELTERDRSEALEENSRLARNAIRVLALAYRPHESLPESPEPERDEREMIFIGLAGMIDPPRPEAIEAVRVCREAGIRPVMITGDYKETAVAIARELGMLADGSGADDSRNGARQALSGAELDAITPEDLARTVRHTNVFARVSPQHKVKLVDALRANGEIVSMTGDGVNDAPALKRADIGVAMGITGTDVAKETADMILTDDNFASIVKAVEEGRVIYSNIRKFIFFLLSCNVGELLIIFTAMLLGWPIPLEPIQILWLNLVTDAFPAVALGLERAEPGIMEKPPRDPKEPIIEWKMRIGIAVQSLTMTAAVLGVFRYVLDSTGDLLTAESFAFTTLIVSELLRSYTARSELLSLFRIGVFSNRYIVGGTAISFALLPAVLYVPFLRPIFSTVPLGPADWLTVTAFAVLPSATAEITKVFVRRREARIERRRRKELSRLR